MKDEPTDDERELYIDSFIIHEKFNHLTGKDNDGLPQICELMISLSNYIKFYEKTFEEDMYFYLKSYMNSKEIYEDRIEKKHPLHNLLKLTEEDYVLAKEYIDSFEKKFGVKNGCYTENGFCFRKPGKRDK